MKSSIIFLSLLIISIQPTYLVWFNPKIFLEKQERNREKNYNLFLGKMFGYKKFNVDENNYDAIINSNRIFSLIYIVICLIGLISSFIPN